MGKHITKIMAKWNTGPKDSYDLLVLLIYFVSLAESQDPKYDSPKTQSEIFSQIAVDKMQAREYEMCNNAGQKHVFWYDTWNFQDSRLLGKD